jgi:dCMP deaminase
LQRKRTEAAEARLVALLERRPNPFEEYFMGIAFAVRVRAKCQGTRVGALIVRDERVVATGYNGTPQDLINCDQGGCYRCAHPGEFESGTAYDVCVCVHAEQNALLSAARFGNEVEGSLIYTTSRPCFGCTKELLQARVAGVRYVHDWTHPRSDLHSQYETLQRAFEGDVIQLLMDDPSAGWALPRRAESGGGGSAPPA